MNSVRPNGTLPLCRWFIQKLGHKSTIEQSMPAFISSRSVTRLSVSLGPPQQLLGLNILSRIIAVVVSRNTDLAYGEV